MSSQEPVSAASTVIELRPAALVKRPIKNRRRELAFVPGTTERNIFGLVKFIFFAFFRVFEDLRKHAFVIKFWVMNGDCIYNSAKIISVFKLDSPRVKFIDIEYSIF